jgi:DNA-binding PadR family transcriptional regulator
MAALIGGEKDWGDLKGITGASDGNLSTHLTKLESMGYVTAKKEFLRKKPHSTYRLTGKAAHEFAEYVEILEELVKGIPD